MIIVSKSGLNLTGQEIERYRVVLIPQHIRVDGVEHRTDEAPPFALVDRWVREASHPPEVVPLSEEELLPVLQETAQRDAEILVVTAGRKLIDSYDAATAAARRMRALPEFARARVRVVDSGSSDVGGGMSVVFAGEAARAGLSLDRTAELTSSFAEGATTVIVPRTLENLVRGGRATFLRAMVANLLGMSPVIGIVDGEMRPVDRVRRSDSASKILEVLGAKIGAGMKVWAAVAHGGNALEARALAERIEETFDVELMLVRPLTSGAYLHLGEDALACTVAPLDQLSWTPARPPSPP